MASALASLPVDSPPWHWLFCSVLASSPAEARQSSQTISPEDMAAIRKQAEEFMEAKDRLPELATLVNERIGSSPT